MGNAVYPTLPGLMFPQQRIVIAPPVQVRTTPSQREYRARDSTRPRYQYGLPYEFLKTGKRGSELQTLVGFYTARGGPFDTFLFTDPDDNTVTGQQFGVGNGSTTTWQLTRSFGGFAEPIDYLNGSASVYRNGVLATSGVTVSAAGLVTFSTAPGAGVVLTWDGSFYRRVRFLGDRMDTARFITDLYEAKKVELLSVWE